jgi:hypothetical protein
MWPREGWAAGPQTMAGVDMFETGWVCFPLKSFSFLYGNVISNSVDIFDISKVCFLLVWNCFSEPKTLISVLL